MVKVDATGVVTDAFFAFRVGVPKYMLEKLEDDVDDAAVLVSVYDWGITLTNIPEEDDNVPVNALKAAIIVL